ncbi:MAG: DUF2247 family protein [bacterium]|nr:DUF2247 family protein [bacterium]
MDFVKLAADFVLDRLELSWSDVKWGYEHGILSAAGVVEFAVARLAEDEDAGSAVVELASLSPQEHAEVPSVLEKVLQSEGVAWSSESRRKWLYLVLAWVHEHRDELPDPLGIVEQVYADFGYPVEIQSFVSYMPPEDGYEPQAHSHEENVARLFTKWKKYLETFTTT